jgi:hypothetical protein
MFVVVPANVGLPKSTAVFNASEAALELGRYFMVPN